MALPAFLSRMVEGARNAVVPLGADQNANRAAPPSAPDAQRVAREVAEAHRRLKALKRQRDLTAEKYVLHIDGEGNGQYADIIDGSFVAVLPSLGVTDTSRLQRNLLRPLVDNMVAYHTAMEFRAVALAPHDRKGRDRALVDTMLANHVIVTQRLNALVAEALYTGAPYGHGILHAQYRDDEAIPEDVPPIYEDSSAGGLSYGAPQMRSGKRGYVDIWPGDPWDTVYSPHSTRRMVPWYSYGRVLPADLVRAAFAHVPGVESLQGADRLSSSARFQRIVSRWLGLSPWASGTAAIAHGLTGTELVAVVCREVAPGFDGRYPDGRLVIVALSGAAEADERSGNLSLGQAMLLHDGPLPGKRFSATRIYPSHRMDDVYGKPWVADLDDLQVQLNHLVTLRAEFLRRHAHPPLVAMAGALSVDTSTTESDAVIEYTSMQPPQFLYPPTSAISFYDNAISETLDQMFRIGGWQAASRGESAAGDAAAKVVALARADDTVFGPSNREIRDAVCGLLQTAHALYRTYMTEPVLAELVGDEWAHLADPWIRKEQLSPRPPNYQLTSGFGASVEARGEQLTTMVQLVGADGQPLLPTRDYWRLYPDPSMRPPENEARRARESRAHACIYAIEKVVEEARSQLGPMAESPEVLMMLFQQLGQEFPLERTDDPALWVEVLDHIVQNVHADPAARQIARWRQTIYFDFMNAIAGQQQAAMMPPAEDGEGGGSGGPQQPAALPVSGSQPGGTATSDAIGDAAGTVQQLTNQAMQQEPAIYG